MMKTRYLLAGSVLALALTGCGDDGPDEVAATADDQPTTTQPTTAQPTTPAPDGEAVEITSVDYAYEDVPETVAAGTELKLVNASDAEAHEMVIFHVDDEQDMSMEEILELAAEDTDGPPPEWLTFAGVAVALPGEEGFTPEGPVVLDEPGRYLLMCFLPTGGDPAALREAMESGATEPPELEGGPPHVAQGMAAELRVE